MLSHHHPGYKNWQFLDNKTLPASLQNDQHLVVSGRDWWRQNWMNSHFRRPSLLNCKGIYFDFWPCPLIFGLDASLSSPVSFSCLWPYKVWSRRCWQGTPLQPLAVGEGFHDMGASAHRENDLLRMDYNWQRPYLYLPDLCVHWCRTTSITFQNIATCTVCLIS